LVSPVTYRWRINMAGKAGGISKVDAVGKAMEKLGEDASRPDIQSFVKKAYGLEIGLDHVSNCKLELRARAAKANKAAEPKATAAAPKAAAVKPAAQKPASPNPTAAASGNGKASGGISLGDVRAAKELLGRVGAAELKGLIDLLSK
jgi:hypothetical protein